MDEWIHSKTLIHSGMKQVTLNERVIESFSQIHSKTQLHSGKSMRVARELFSLRQKQTK